MSLRQPFISFLSVLFLWMSAAFSPLFAANENDDAEVKKALSLLEAFYAETQDFKADFTQIVERAHIQRPLKKSGTVYFSKPGKMRWDYLVPEKVYYISNGDILWSYEREAKQVFKMNIANSELYDSLGFLMGRGDLMENFNIEGGPFENGVKTLVLRPKGSQKNYQSLSLFVDLSSGEVQKTELLDPLDNLSTITFSNVSHEALKAEGFQFTPPPGTQVRDLTEGGGSEPEAP